MIRIFLVDDHVAFREPLAFMLNRESDFEVVGQAGTLAGASRFQDPVDIAVVDLGLPDGDGVHLVHELRTRNPHASVLVLTGSDERLRDRKVASSRCRGSATQIRRHNDIIAAIRRVSGRMLAQRD